ncbi:MAG: formylmethanofuran dehydrogenase subunit A [Planctomycetota bacterium]
MLKIEGGAVYDPANGVDGAVQDVWVDGGKIVPPPAGDAKPSRVIDARGLVVMPGGIDMHCHIVGPKVNAARKMRPDDKRLGREAVERRRATAGGAPTRSGPFTRSGTMGSVPSTFATAYKYAALGYTSAFDAAVPPLGARQAHQELADTPCLDKGVFVLMGNNRYAMQCLQQDALERLREYMAWLLRTTKGFAPKLVNPGGVEVWKQRASGNVEGLDDPVPGFGLTPRRIIQGLVQAANDLGLPHPTHLHCNQLGMPGNWSTTLDTMRALEGRKAHLTHIQFHSYGGGGSDGGDRGEEDTLGSRVGPLADYVNSHPNVSVDVGQVMFGATTNMTGDGPLGHFLYNVSRQGGGPGAKWYCHDTEVESGCGVLPMKYRNKNLFNAIQWAAGLEWYLMVEDPWRVVMSTDHPNGASFLAYPQLIRLLMDRTYRADLLKTCPPRLLERSTLADLDREYTLSEIAIITRAGPARLLGLANKGHLGVGADADITLYTPDANQAVMFELPRMVIKAGEVMVEHGEVRAAPTGKTLHVEAPLADDALTAGALADLPEYFEQHYSVPLEAYGVQDSEVPKAEAVR